MRSYIGIYMVMCWRISFNMRTMWIKYKGSRLYPDMMSRKFKIYSNMIHYYMGYYMSKTRRNSSMWMDMSRQLSFDVNTANVMTVNMSEMWIKYKDSRLYPDMKSRKFNIYSDMSRDHVGYYMKSMESNSSMWMGM